ncbi:HAD-IIA family hydrolase [Halarcobacter sp.]|uniref:HAD-IIA family hydrolase n=1 Tax=Halarcobacter sp. TaxID=2321133 RepID=UPI0029F48DD5|nr:HAD-IIA family hydrolase [Halarcobacter sp.]
MYKILKDIDFIIFDLDGVFYREDENILGTKEIIDYLNSNGIEYCFFTNNSNYKTKRYKEKLLKGAVDVNENKIYTTTKLIEHYLFENCANDIYVLGSTQLQESLYTKYQKNTTSPEFIIIGMDNNITLKAISNTINLIGENTQIIAANPDKLIPLKDRFELECGVINSIISEFTNKEIKIIGKPNSYGYETILNKFNKKKEKTMMIGDTYDTDILGAKNSKINPAWIKTGNDLPKYVVKKDFMIFDSLIDLKEKLEKAKRN